MASVGGEEWCAQVWEAEGQWLVLGTLHSPNWRLQVGEQEVVGAWSNKPRSLHLHLVCY